MTKQSSRVEADKSSKQPSDLAPKPTVITSSGVREAYVPSGPPSPFLRRAPTPGLATADLVDDGDDHDRTVVDNSIVAPIEAWPDEDEETPTCATPIHLVAALRAVITEGPGEETRVVTSPIERRHSVPELLAGPPSSDPLNPSYVPPSARSSQAHLPKYSPPSSTSVVAPIPQEAPSSSSSRAAPFTYPPAPPARLVGPPYVPPPSVGFEPPPSRRLPWLPLLVGAGIAAIAVVLFFLCTS